MADEAKAVRELPIKESIKLILKALEEAARELDLAKSFRDLAITEVLPEGPAIVIYTRRIDLVGNDEIAKRAAKRVKKRMEIRADKSIRAPEDEAREIIKNIVPPEAGILSMVFDDSRDIVYIFAEDPGLVIGHSGELRREIIRRTGRIPKVIKAPDIAFEKVELLYRIFAASASVARDNLIQIGFRIHRPRIYKVRDIRISFLGAAFEVGRSSMLIQTPNSNILVDFGLGLQQGRMYPRLDLSGIPLDEIDAVIVTHAHMDHAGLVPMLYKFGYRGPVYMTSATRDLAILLRTDYINLAKRLGHIAPYTNEDIQKTIQHTITIDYNLKRPDKRSDVTDIAPDVRLTFYNAGHILGSAIVHLHIGDGMHNIVIAQDFRYSDSVLLEKAVSQFPRVETLIMETTYGGGKADNPSRSRDRAKLISEISKTISGGGCVLIPVLSVGRAQEVLLHIYFQMKRNNLPKDTPIFVDGMVVDATAIHTAHTEMLSSALRKFMRYENPFTAENVIYITSSKARSEALSCEKPSIILASNGMLNGGPAVEYFEHLAVDEKNKIIFVSYQAPGTLGYYVSSLASKPPSDRKVEIDGREIPVRAEIVPPIRGLTSHSIYSELIRYVEDVKKNNPTLRNIVLIHGEPKKILHMSSVLSKKFAQDNVRIITPVVGASVKL